MKHHFIYILFVYLIATQVEYIIHRFIMHKKYTELGKNHITHHRNTNDTNMDLENLDSPEYNKLHPYYNLIMTPTEFVPIMIGMLAVAWMFNKFYPVKLDKQFLVIVPVIMILYVVFTWNSVHSYIHHRDARDLTVFSFPYKFTERCVQTNPLFRWIVNNHVKHHVYKGDKKGNYNITLPGADFIWGTYN